MRSFLCFLLAVSTECYSQSEKTAVKFVNPSTLAAPKGYSTAVHVDLGAVKMVIISGLIARDKQGNVVGKGDPGKQAEQIFTNMKAVIEDAGGSMNDIVKLTWYFIDVSQIQIFRDVRDRFVNTKNPPASTAVQVSKLVGDDYLLEVEATAVIQVQ